MGLLLCLNMFVAVYPVLYGFALPGDAAVAGDPVSMSIRGMRYPAHNSREGPYWLGAGL